MNPRKKKQIERLNFRPDRTASLAGDQVKKTTERAASHGGDAGGGHLLGYIYGRRWMEKTVRSSRPNSLSEFSKSSNGADLVDTKAFEISDKDEIPRGFLVRRGCVR